ncbi:MAG: alpha/beta fold hydrolase [Candidatus Methylomirabilales bacterium]|jgi:pimeloyl-ACP methyl ester carboxylesterase
MGSGWTVRGSLIGFFAVPVVVSYVVEAMRSAPATPTRLSWAPEVPIKYVKINGINLRYVDVGEGPPLVLLHTLRTQLDMFQKVIPELSKYFRVYALDYPGHGFSDIPTVEYTPEFFTDVVARFLEQLNIQDAIVAGESIGGSISLVLAARHNLRVKQVIAINAYDYDAGRGIMRGSPVAKLLFSLNNVPILGSTFWRLRQYPVFKLIMEGGVVHKDALPSALLREMHEVGNRPHHYRAFMSLVRHWAGWEDARANYAKIAVPVLLVYGEGDWSRPDEREANHRAIPGAQMTIVKDASHFLSLDAPDALIQHILNFSHARQEGVTEHSGLH